MTIPFVELDTCDDGVVWVRVSSVITISSAYGDEPRRRTLMFENRFAALEILDTPENMTKLFVAGQQP